MEQTIKLIMTTRNMEETAKDASACEAYRLAVQRKLESEYPDTTITVVVSDRAGDRDTVEVTGEDLEEDESLVRETVLGIASDVFDAGGWESKAETPSPAKGTTVTIESTVDPDWIEFVTAPDTDLFRTVYCGMYLFGVAHEEGRGWLAFEHEEKHTLRDAPNKRAAVKAWVAGTALPKGYYALDLATAKKAWAEGVKWRGERWFQEGDGPAYGYALQKAIFGEERYT